jgi:hypothetical protein
MLGPLTKYRPVQAESVARFYEQGADTVGIGQVHKGGH